LKKQNREEELFDLIKSEICEFEEDKERFYSILIELYEILSNLYHEKGNIELAEIYIQKANELKNKWYKIWDEMIEHGFLIKREEE
jgi:Rad3-related DNA helicase